MTEQASERPELIIALVCPLGARIQTLEGVICDELKNYGYRCESIRISDLLEKLDFWTPEPDGSEQTRIQHRQSKALEFRRKGGPDALARAVIAAIRESRRRISGHPDKPANACAYILRQLKHPKEIHLLRHVYGQSIFVVAGHAPEEIRVRDLADTMAQKEGKASADEYENAARTLIHVDEKEDNPDDEEAKLGQNTRDTYPLADFFVSLAQNDGDPVRRFIQLLFGHPFRTPTPEEMAMHQANAIALRSSDERRQVGAVIVTRTKRSDSAIMDADIVASGMNEVPRRQGGFYWEGEFLDARDQALRRSSPVDLEDRIKADALREIATQLKRNEWLAPELVSLEEVELSSKLLQLLKRTQFMDISEFMRQVHAEMAALVDAAKRGVAVRGGEMYVTTFPCHNCAKHIIAAGITRVIYLEPYPKSRAEMLHRDEIALDPADPKSVGDRVLFVPFTGVAPRQYARLFSMSARGRKNGLVLNEWHDRRGTLSPQYVLANAAHAYTRTEREELERLPKEYKWDRAVLCPA
jgi:cytidine deaminase